MNPTGPDRRVWGRLFLGLLLLLLGYDLWALSQPGVVETRIVTLLPGSEREERLEQAVAALAEPATRRVYFLVSHPVADSLAPLGKRLFSVLVQSGQFLPPKGPTGLEELYLTHPWAKLSSPVSQALFGPNPGPELLEQTRRQLFSPFSSFFSHPAQDPLLLLPSLLRELAPLLPPASGVREFDHSHLGFVLELSHSAFDFEATLADQRAVEAAWAAAEPGEAQLSWTGVSRYANQAAHQAKGEMNWIGGGSLLGVVLLLGFAFGSWRTVVTGLLPVLAGLTLGLAGVLVVFGQLHLLTLVFGGSLVGVAVDYGFHGLVHTRYAPPAAMARLYPALKWGFLTSLASYLALGIAPFPGLRQVALFSGLGLLGAYLWVRLRLGPGPLVERPRFLGWAAGSLGLYPRLRPQALALLLALLSLSQLPRLYGNDDLERLASRPARLLAEEKEIRAYFPELSFGSFFLVEAPDPDTLALRLEALSQKVPGWSLARIWSGPAEQERQRQALALAWKAGLGDELAKLGYEKKILEDFGRHLEQGHPLALETLPLPGLFVRSQDRWYAPLVPQPALGLGSDQDLIGPGVHWIDPGRDTAFLLGRYRERIGWALGLAYLGIALFLLRRYGWSQGAKTLLPPLLAGLSVLGLLGALGQGVNLFDLLGLLLVLGVGVDYGLFFAENPEAPAKILVAVWLSAVTTLLAFGLLAFSQTGALVSLGRAVGVGVAVAWFFSPLARKKED